MWVWLARVEGTYIKYPRGSEVWLGVWMKVLFDECGFDPFVKLRTQPPAQWNPVPERSRRHINKCPRGVEVWLGG